MATCSSLPELFEFKEDKELLILPEASASGRGTTTRSGVVEGRHASRLMRRCLLGDQRQHAGGQFRAADQQVGELRVGAVGAERAAVGARDV